jgi:hypothetical protein
MPWIAKIIKTGCVAVVGKRGDEMLDSRDGKANLPCSTKRAVELKLAITVKAANPNLRRGNNLGREE